VAIDILFQATTCRWWKQALAWRRWPTRRSSETFTDRCQNIRPFRIRKTSRGENPLLHFVTLVSLK